MIHRHFAFLATTALLLLGGLGLASPAAAERAAAFAANVTEALDLDAETRRAVAEIVERSGERDATLRSELHDQRKRLRALMEAGESPDETAILTQADAIGATESALHKNRLRAILEIRKRLSAEQRRELVSLRGDDHEHHHRAFRGIRSCRPDLKERCPGITEGREVLACLHDHWDTLSPRCQRGFGAGRHHGSKHPDSQEKD